jgi:hypothetical protein
MAAEIDAREARLKERFQPADEFECMMVREMARAGVQMDVSHEQLIEDNIRVSEKTDSDWHDDRTREANRLGARLAAEPSQVKDQLEETLHGANWLLYRWRALRDEAVENQGLDESQRQLAFDLLGVPVTGRRGTTRVPAGNDVEGIEALCAREIRRLETRVVLELEGRDTRARAKARRGLPVVASDAATRRVKSNESRARKRLMWAYETFNSLRMGVALEMIIDPETRRPLRPAAAAPAQAEPPPAAAPEPPPAPAEADPVPLPDDVAGEKKELLLLMGATLRDLFRAGLLKPPAAPPDAAAVPPAG